MSKNKKTKIKNLINQILAGIGIVLFWRGIWNLTDMYILPNNPVISSILTIILGLSILYFNDFSLEEIT